jgi:C1A family cysteine protease
MKKTASFSKIFILASALLIVACKKEDQITPTPPPPTPPPATETTHTLGYAGDDNVSKVPTTPNLGYGEGDLPSQIDLTPKFPPIGDQGQYGTCVAWAVAYNLKTALNGMDRGLSASQLASPSNQFSPRDLFTAIPDSEKGSDCKGTNFTCALDVLQERGVATMQTVPYTTLGNCSQSNLQDGWTSEANNNKIKYWRKIEPTIQDIKKNIAYNIPVVFAAKLSDNFMTWNSDNVLSSNTTYNTVGQHAYHALIIAGYDDNKGSGGAFKVINSWGRNWGSEGYIWIDYNFFISEFCNSSDGDKPIFIASNDQGNVNPPAPEPSTSGVDLAPWVFSDVSYYTTGGEPTERAINYNLYNIGNAAASSNSDWSLYYIYYNAYDANDYGVLFYDDFNASTGADSWECSNSGNCTFNYTIPAGGDLSTTVFNSTEITRTYYMPKITGEYYLVLIADVNDKFSEQDELNNLFYTSILPSNFSDGYAERKATGSGFKFRNDLMFDKFNLKKSKFNTVVTPQFKNAYTQKEILSFFKKEIRTGALKNKINQSLQKRGKVVYRHS